MKKKPETRNLGLQNCKPRKLMTDFEKAILDASEQVFVDISVGHCSFHFGQSVFGRIQSESLLKTYNDPDDRKLIINTYLHAAWFYFHVSE